MSNRPGTTICPVPSITSAFAGTLTTVSAPTAWMRSATTRTVWPLRTMPVSESNTRTCWIARPASGVCRHRSRPNRSYAARSYATAAMTAPTVATTTTPPRRTFMRTLPSHEDERLGVGTNVGRERQLDGDDQSGLGVAGIDSTLMHTNCTLRDRKPKARAIVMASGFIDAEERLKDARQHI